ncbi:MAG TPA: TauD/TfdA family dioxygenase [Acidimicrobiia bacterium]|nr:TauD/TfdA family dioxygenase [Acidimicrobiia bacterium]
MVCELEPAAEWRAADVADPERWTLRLEAADHEELDAALRAARAVGGDPLAIRREDFPLEALATKLSDAVTTLLDGRGFVRISALDVDRYSDDDLSLLYWGIGLHLGEPWPQNKHGHVLGDVTDQGKSYDDPTARGNELGAIALDYHTDGSDLVGLLCLRTARRGGLSCVANAVAIHNALVRERPDLAALLYEPLPYDLRGEEKDGTRPFFTIPAFTEHHGRLFVRFIPPYIYASQRHADAPRLSDDAKEAITAAIQLANDPDFNVYMDLQPGEMQFINNYHVLHGRTAYEDDPASGHKRHLKRLWLATHRLTDRPLLFQARGVAHWAERRSVSHVAAVDRPSASRAGSPATRSFLRNSDAPTT